MDPYKKHECQNAFPSVNIGLYLDPTIFTTWNGRFILCAIWDAHLKGDPNHHKNNEFRIKRALTMQVTFVMCLFRNITQSCFSRQQILQIFGNVSLLSGKINKLPKNVIPHQQLYQIASSAVET